MLYLDTDILCQGDLQELSAYDLTGYAAAMVRDLCQLDGEHRKLFIDNGLDAKDYFNSGVMLIHIPNWFSLNIPEKIHHFISETKNIDLKYPDQDILNLALSSKVKELPSRYNWLYWLGKFNFHKNNPDIAIVHYIGCDKPWTTYCFDDCYNVYYQKSPWSDVPFLGIPKNKTASQIRVISKRLWIRGEKRFACKVYWGYLLMKVKLFKHYPF